MKFSVLIPVYNVEKYIDECMASVLSQTYSDFEVILVDDGSADDCPKICDGYAKRDSRVKVIHQKNKGQIYARLEGVKNASGEYCIFIDSDDVIKTDTLETLKKYIESYAPDMVMYSFVYYDGKKTSPRNKKLFEDGYIIEDGNKKELYENFISGSDYYSICTKCIKTEILRNDPTDYERFLGLKMSEDMLHSIYLITNAKRIVFADKELYLYRYNPQSVSNTMYADAIYKKNTSHVYSAIKEYLPLWGLDDEKHRKRLYATQFEYAMYTFSQYYKAVPKAERKKVVDFNWDSFIPEPFEPNEYCSEHSRLLYAMIKKSEYLKIRLYFTKQKIYSEYKKIKRRLKYILYKTDINRFN